MPTGFVLSKEIAIKTTLKNLKLLSDWTNHFIVECIPDIQVCIPNLLLLFLWRTSVQFNHSVVSDSLWPHESQHARPPCPSPTPGVYSNSCPSSWWCHPAISSSVVPFSSCPQQYLIHIPVSFLVVKDIWYTTFYTFDSSSSCKW